MPKKFTPWLYYLQNVAELGFIVVQLDAMTTSFRNLNFEQVCYKNLKDAGFPDRIEWIKAAAKKYPYLDIDRMGIYGCSAGGQEALGALLHLPSRQRPHQGQQELRVHPHPRRPPHHGRELRRTQTRRLLRQKPLGRRSTQLGRTGKIIKTLLATRVAYII